LAKRSKCFLTFGAPTTRQGMEILVYSILSQLNRWLLPRFSRRPDLTQLKKWEQALIGWKMWVTYRYLDAKNNA